MVLLQMFEDSHSSFCTSMQSLQCQQSIEVQDTCFLCFLMRPFVNSLVISWESECMLIWSCVCDLGHIWNLDQGRIPWRKQGSLGQIEPGSLPGKLMDIDRQAPFVVKRWRSESSSTFGPFSSGNLTALLRINIEKNDFPEGCPVARGSGPRCLFLTSSFLNAGPFKALQPLYFFVGQMWLQRNGRTFAGIVDPPLIVYLVNFGCQQVVGRSSNQKIFAKRWSRRKIDGVKYEKTGTVSYCKVFFLTREIWCRFLR